MVRNYAAERKEQMRNELKVQLPVPIDSKRYLIGRISFFDLALISPFFLITSGSLYLFYLMGMLNKYTVIIAILPTIAVAGMQFTKHRVRKEISFIQYGIIWKYKYKKREKTYFYRKGELQMKDKQDGRRKIGIKNVFADCYETKDNRFVRVLEVSSINLSLSNKQEKKSALESFKVFMTTTSFLKSLQFSQIAQPINLTKHLHHVKKNNKEQDNEIKNMLMKSYENFILGIQSSRELVTRKRYVIISQKIGSDREKALDQIDQLSKLTISKLEGMTFDYASLSAKQLNNDELTKLMFTSVDYDSAVVLGDHILSRTSNKSSISVGQDTAHKLIETLTKQLKETVK